VKRLWRWIASFRRRILFRLVFLALIGATLALALAVLQQEKQQRIDGYRSGLQRTQAQALARLQHPSGQLALMNPQTLQRDGAVPLRPVVLPYSAIDADDPVKLLQAMETAGCLVQYPNGQLCASVAHSPWAGAYLYVAGQALTHGPLVSRARGERDAATAHRVQVQLHYRGEQQAWVAPFESRGDARRGQLVGFDGDAHVLQAGRPQREFRGWLWQSPLCVRTAAPAEPCAQRATFALRLPVEALRAELFDRQARPAWPPADLHTMSLRLRLLAPGDAAPLLDSDDPKAVLPFAGQELRSLLRPGETLQVQRGDAPLWTLRGDAGDDPVAPWLVRLVRRLPAGGEGPVQLQAPVATPLGPLTLQLQGHTRSIDAGLAAVATRLAWYVGAMLLAIVLAWLLIELLLIRRIALLTRRARAVSRDIGSHGVSELQVADLRGHDELGILAGVLADLVQRVREDWQRERLRAEREKDQWHAVGHEIMSPLQSLMVLHPDPDDPSARYVHRMQQAVRVLYGSASPSEAFEATTLQLQPLDLLAFVQHVAANAPAEGIADVVLQAPAVAQQLMVRADEYPLEDVVTHVLRNAVRYREPGTPITLHLTATPEQAVLRIHNQGPPIPPALIDKVFEYGVSNAAPDEEGANRGQGLFVAKTYLAKMGGTISVRNEADGVSFELRLQRV